MVENNSLDVQVTSSTQVFPESSQGAPTTVALSIIDSTVLNFARCAGIWYFDPPSSPESTISISNLRESLSKTLNSYPQLSGRVSFVTSRPNSGHTNRYRQMLEFPSSSPHLLKQSQTSPHSGNHLSRHGTDLSFRQTNFSL
jgi:hypothetical protein